MQRQSSKDIEMKILKSIFTDHDNSDIIHIDSPDFILAAPSHKPFGVEINQIYHHQTEGRMINDPDYARRILSGGRYNKKEDDKVLTPVEFKAEFKNGDKHMFRGVSMYGPTTEEHRKILFDSLSSKSSKIAEYRKNSAHDVVLIIMDYMTLVDRCTASNIMTPELEQLVRKSEFKEIYVVSAADGNYVPLKMVMLASSLYRFRESLNKFDSLRGMYASEATETMVSFMNSIGMDAKICELSSGEPVAVYGMSMQAIHKDGSHNMFDLRNNIQWVEELRLPILPKHVTNLDRFLKYHSRRNPYEKVSSVNYRLKIKADFGGYKDFTQHMRGTPE